MPLFCSRKGDTPVEPGPNPFKPPMILNIHMKYDERVQTLEVLVRNLQNSPRGEKVKAKLTFVLITLKVVGIFLERSTCDRRKKPGFVGRVIRREKTDDEGYVIKSYKTSSKAGPNPHFNKKFPFGDLIRCKKRHSTLEFSQYSATKLKKIVSPNSIESVISDVHCGKLIFEIHGSGFNRKKIFGCVEMDGSEIQIDQDTAYSLYVRDPSCTPTQYLLDQDVTIPTIQEQYYVSFLAFRINQLYEIVNGLGRKRAYSHSDCDSISISSSSSSSSGDSDITIYEIVQVDPCKASTLSGNVYYLIAAESSIDECTMILRSNIQHDVRQQKLTVFIRNLGIVDDKLPHFVKCVLYTADGRRLERKTGKKYGCNPYFNQELVFSKLVQADIRGGHLLFTVLEKKRCGKKVIGMGIIPGSRINLCRDEAYCTAIVQQYCSMIPQKFIYNPKDVDPEPDNLIRVVYPECQKHMEVYN
ncbi:unnamed protein product [Rodentolepis nana]|uniref:C2 domain-containing protein n=1 Tax=Rodentolepis nana TaxID=102285 RepID=A0A158QH27_RODNA|nr:unnamed protein product [Rodentolepis nana]